MGIQVTIDLSDKDIKLIQKSFKSAAGDVPTQKKITKEWLEKHLKENAHQTFMWAYTDAIIDSYVYSYEDEVMIEFS